MRVKCVRSIAFFSLLISFFSHEGFSQETIAFSNKSIIPQPLHYEQTGTSFSITSSTAITYSEGVDANTANFLRDIIAAHGVELSLKKKKTNDAISLKINPEFVPQKEGYHLKVDKKKIEIVGHDQQGVFYGIQTLSQLINPDNGKLLKIEGCEIADAPRFGYRGMHLDVSRHMFPVSFIKKYIDLLAFYKFNTFHWHLTDDQGWRIEIKKYPNLQTIAAFRDETLIGHKKELPHRFDGERYGGYYSQEEVKDIVQYAANRHITVIPEIEMPGHASAALTAYPEFGCTEGPYKTATFWGIFDEVFCAGKEETFSFLEDVLDEVIDLFPSHYIHVGGDECPKTRWKECPRCQKRIAEEGLKDEDELQSYFIRRIEKHLNKKGRQLIGWDEILEGGLSPTATVMSWRGEIGGIEAAKQKNDVIMIPDTHVYFDYYQSLSMQEPVASASYLPVSKAYSYDPVPESLTEEEKKYIKGVQGAVWSEYMATTAHAEYMMFPRIIALSEVAWTQKENKDYRSFVSRLDYHTRFLKKAEVNYFKHYDEITYAVDKNPEGKVILELIPFREQHTIRYTLDGSTPSIKSQLYEKPLTINQTATVKALLFADDQPTGRVWEKNFLLSKATGTEVQLKNSPVGGFAGAPFTLVNGLEGTHRYNEGQWLGFSGEDLEAVIDLGAVETVKTIGANFLKYHWQRMWAPTELQFLVSEDGKNYKVVHEEKEFPINGINKVKADIDPVKARYVKVSAKNIGIVPKGEYGEGGKAWMLIDQIFID